MRKSQELPAPEAVKLPAAPLEPAPAPAAPAKSNQRRTTDSTLRDSASTSSSTPTSSPRNSRSAGGAAAGATGRVLSPQGSFTQPPQAPSPARRWGAGPGPSTAASPPAVSLPAPRNSPTATAQPSRYASVQQPKKKTPPPSPTASLRPALASSTSPKAPSSSSTSSSSASAFRSGLAASAATVSTTTISTALSTTTVSTTAHVPPSTAPHVPPIPPHIILADTADAAIEPATAHPAAPPTPQACAPPIGRPAPSLLSHRAAAAAKLSAHDPPALSSAGLPGREPSSVAVNSITTAVADAYGPDGSAASSSLSSTAAAETAAAAGTAGAAAAATKAAEVMAVEAEAAIAAPSAASGKLLPDPAAAADAEPLGSAATAVRWTDSHAAAACACMDDASSRHPTGGGTAVEEAPPGGAVDEESSTSPTGGAFQDTWAAAAGGSEPGTALGVGLRGATSGEPCPLSDTPPCAAAGVSSGGGFLGDVPCDNAFSAVDQKSAPAPLDAAPASAATNPAQGGEVRQVGLPEALSPDVCSAGAVAMGSLVRGACAADCSATAHVFLAAGGAGSLMRSSSSGGGSGGLIRSNSGGGVGSRRGSGCGGGSREADADSDGGGGSGAVSRCIREGRRGAPRQASLAQWMDDYDAHLTAAVGAPPLPAPPLTMSIALPTQRPAAAGAAWAGGSLQESAVPPPSRLSRGVHGTGSGGAGGGGASGAASSAAAEQSAEGGGDGDVEDLATLRLPEWHLGGGGGGDVWGAPTAPRGLSLLHPTSAGSSAIADWPLRGTTTPLSAAAAQLHRQQQQFATSGLFNPTAAFEFPGSSSGALTPMFLPRTTSAAASAAAQQPPSACPPHKDPLTMALAALALEGLSPLELLSPLLMEALSPSGGARGGGTVRRRAPPQRSSSQKADSNPLFHQASCELFQEAVTETAADALRAVYCMDRRAQRRAVWKYYHPEAVLQHVAVQASGLPCIDCFLALYPVLLVEVELEVVHAAEAPSLDSWHVVYVEAKLRTRLRWPLSWAWSWCTMLLPGGTSQSAGGTRLLVKLVMDDKQLVRQHEVMSDLRSLLAAIPLVAPLYCACRGAAGLVLRVAALLLGLLWAPPAALPPPPPAPPSPLRSEPPSPPVLRPALRLMAAFPNCT